MIKKLQEEHASLNISKIVIQYNHLCRAILPKVQIIFILQLNNGTKWDIIYLFQFNNILI
jgi:hypothetical protein